MNSPLSLVPLPKDISVKLKMNSSIIAATRETALLHAISTAAITHEITQQCRENKIPGCRCVELKNRQPNNGNGDWQWGGCSDNIWFGENVTRRFIDDLEQDDDARKVVNLHNNELGRKVSVSVEISILSMRSKHSEGRGKRAMPPARKLEQEQKIYEVFAKVLDSFFAEQWSFSLSRLCWETFGKLLK